MSNNFIKNYDVLFNSNVFDDVTNSLIYQTNIISSSECEDNLNDNILHKLANVAVKHKLTNVALSDILIKSITL